MRPKISNNPSVQSGSTRGKWNVVPSKNWGRMVFQPWENSSRVKPSASSAGSLRNFTSSVLKQVSCCLYNLIRSSSMRSRFTVACVQLCSPSHSFSLASYNLLGSGRVTIKGIKLEERESAFWNLQQKRIFMQKSVPPLKYPFCYPRLPLATVAWSRFVDVISVVPIA